MVVHAFDSFQAFHQKVSCRLLNGLFKDLNIRVGSHQIKVPLVDMAGMHLLHWKTQLKAHALNQS